MNLNKRQQLLAIVAIAAVGLFMADKIIVTPLTKSWDARSKRIAKLKEDVRTGDDLLKHEKSWRDQWTQMHANLLSTDKAVAESQMMKALPTMWSSGRRRGCRRSMWERWERPRLTPERTAPF